MQNQETNGNAPPLRASLAQDTSQQTTQTSRSSPFGFNKVHRPIIDIESSEKPVEEVPPSKQSNAPSVSPEKCLESASPGPAPMKTAAQKARPENERMPKKHCMKTRNGNRQLDKIPVSTRVVSKQGPKKPETRKPTPRDGGQFRQTNNPPSTRNINQNRTANLKGSLNATCKLELKEEHNCNRKSISVLEEHLLLMSGSKTPEPNDKLSPENTETENKILSEQSAVETNEVIVRDELLIIGTGALADGTDKVEALEDGEIPDIPSEINCQSTGDNGIENVSEASNVQEAVHNSSGSFSSSFPAWQSVNRVRSIETDIFKNKRAQQTSFKNVPKSSRGKSNSSKGFSSSSKQHDEKNEIKDCLARLIKSEETVRRKFEHEAQGREYVLMFLPEAFADGSLDESTIAGLYGRFNVDQVYCHYNGNGERLGSGTMRVWDNFTGKVENHVPGRKWRALRMLPLKTREVSENADQVVKAFVQFLDDWPEEKIEKALRDACPGSDIQMIYDYNNLSFQSALVTVKYSNIEKLNVVVSSSNNMVHPLQVRIFEVPRTSITGHA